MVSSKAMVVGNSSCGGWLLVFSWYDGDARCYGGGGVIVVVPFPCHRRPLL